MVFISGKLKVGWESLLPSFHAMDVIDPQNSGWAESRLYTLSWLGVSVNVLRTVDRPILPASSVEPWEWIDNIVRIFRN